MIYNLYDLLQKMGAPELRDRKRLEWYYFDKTRNSLAGHAEIRLEAGGEFLVAELKRYGQNTGQGDAALAEESFFLYAERTARPDHYRVTRLSFDGQDYGHPTPPIVELGLGVFQSRALDISIRMVEQTFNREDMLTPPAADDLSDIASLVTSPPTAADVGPAEGARKLPRRRVITQEGVRFPEKTTQQEAYGVVVPFRPRHSVPRFGATG